jgi:putative zinc finger protein
MSDMKHLDEGTIHAWLDGALSPDESAGVEAHANACADCAALVAEARGLIAASSRILSSLDAVPSGVVPGSTTGTDQLAVLRARRAAMARVWWRDRRFVAAASLVLVAGVSSVVWRSTQHEAVPARADSTMSAGMTPPAAAPAVSPATPGEPATREALPGTSKAEGGAPLRDQPRINVANKQASESTANVKLAASTVASAREAAAAGATQQAIDSTKALSRADQSAFERKVQQTVQSAPTPPRIIPEQQQQAGAASPVAPPPSAAPLAVRNRNSADAASFGVGLRIADAKSVAGGCYALTPLTPGEAQRTVMLADTVQLLDEPLPERSDPSWLRARTVGARDTILAWRLVDSTTVELRVVPKSPSERALRTFLMRFRALPPGAQLPDVTGMTNVRAALAVRVTCR